jgi:hypothetical protein
VAIFTGFTILLQKDAAFRVLTEGNRDAMIGFDWRPYEMREFADLDW